MILFVRADTWIASGTGQTWCYEVHDGEACIVCNSDFNPSVLPPPEGDLVIPESLDGVPVTGIGDYAFRGCYYLKDLTIPDSIAYIGEGAFDGCCSITNLTVSQYVLEQGLANVFPESLASLETVTILDGATSIPANAFVGCTALRCVTIPPSVAGVAANAFAGCTGIRNVMVPQSVLDMKLSKVFPDACRSIESATILDGATRVSDSAFRNCSGLVRVSIPSSATSIENSAFKDCRSLESVDIPNGVTGIGKYAFQDCTSLSGVSIPSSVTSIGAGAFYGCGSLVDVVIPEGVTSIELSAFRNCTSLSGVSMPSSVTSIGSGAFYGCDSLVDVVIPEGVTSIGLNAFRNCTSLSSVSIPSSAVSIGAGAFYGCSSLVDVVVPEGVASIGSRAFRNCTSLSSVSIPSSVVSIGSSAFYGCTGIKSLAAPQTVLAKRVKNLLPGACASIEHVTILDGATSIPANAFAGCEGLKSVEIPASVASIAKRAFAGCWNIKDIAVSQPVLDTGLRNVFPDAYGSLEGVTILDGATSIPDYAFSGCLGLTNAAIPGSVTTIGCDAFADCSGLADLTLSEGLTSIAEGAFRGCAGLTSVVIPESVGSMGQSAFVGCTGLRSVTLPSGMRCIGDAMFWGCASLESVAIPIGIREIGMDAFNGCSGLTSLALPDHVEVIGERAFADCAGLTSLTIPASVTWIGEAAFAGCTGVTDLAVPQAVFDTGFDRVFSSDSMSLRRVAMQDGVVNIGDCAFSCQYDLESVTIPEGVKSIGAGAFQGCYGLSEVALPESLTSIGSLAFAMSSVCCVSIPRGVTSVASDAFAGCPGLTAFSVAEDNPCYKSVSGLLLTKDGKTLVCGVNGDVSIPDGVTKIEDMAFGGCSDLTSVTIPGSVTNIGNYAFSWCGALESLVLHDGLAQIGDGAFSECYSLASVAIPGSVTSIGDSAFCACREIRCVTIPQAVLDTGLQNVFPDSCDMIEQVTIIAGATSIPADAFAGCVGLKSVEISASVTTIADGAFADCRNISDVSVSQSVLDTGIKDVFPGSYDKIGHVTILDGATSIPADAFSGCEGLKSVEIPSSVVNVEAGAFEDCIDFSSVAVTQAVLERGLQNVFPDSYRMIEHVTILDGATCIPSYAFASCSGLLSVTIPDSVTSIEGDAFASCDNLGSITIPDRVSYIGRGAFSGCAGLTSVRLPEGLSSVDDFLFYGCTGLTSVTIPDSVTSIGRYAFYGCAGLEDVALYGYVERIGDNAFSGCTSLAVVALYGFVETIEEYAFYGCANLADVMLYGGVSSIEDYAFGDCPALTHVDVPRYCQLGDMSFDSRAVWDEFVAKLGDLDPFSCPEGSTNTVLEHLFYSGTTNGDFTYPVSTADTAVLKVSASGDGIGRLYVGDLAVPLVAPQATESGVASNTLLIPVPKGVYVDIGYEMLNGLNFNFESDEFMIGSYGWIAFPHTEATVPCFHDLLYNEEAVSLVHGEEFPGLTATWDSDNEDVMAFNVMPVSAFIHGRFKKGLEHSVFYTVDHPDRLSPKPMTFQQTLRFCPRLEDIEIPPGASEYPDGDMGWGRDEGHSQDPDEISEGEAEYEYDRISALETAKGVLQLYGDVGRTDMLSLVVPDGEPIPCCGCPDHCKDNHVALASKSWRLWVRDLVGNDFEIAQVDMPVEVRGTFPSQVPYGDGVLFATNGAQYLSKSYTVLGLLISNPSGPDISEYNSMSETFGFPVTVNTDLDNDAASLQLRTDVMLPGGFFRLAIENATAPFQIWTKGFWAWDSNCKSFVPRPPALLLDSETVGERHFTMRQWRDFCEFHSDSCERTLDVVVVSPSPGSCDLAFSYVFDHSGSAIRSSARQRIYALGAPVLVFDYDRDGEITDEEAEIAREGKKTFRFWINDDRDTGDVCENYNSDFPFDVPWLADPALNDAAFNLLHKKNYDNNEVNGRRDLEDFTPVWIDMRGVFPPNMPTHLRDMVKWELKSDYVNAVWTAYMRNEAGLFLKEDDRKCFKADHKSGVDPRQYAYKAGVSDLRKGVELPDEFNKPFLSDECRVILIEGRASNLTTEGPGLTLIARDKQTGSEILRSDANLKVSTVMDMMRWLCLRSVEGDDPKRSKGNHLGEPQNRPDAECDDTQIVFVHGFNVNPDEAVSTGVEMFKRLWQSGCDSMFTVVDWYGDEDQWNNIVVNSIWGTSSPDYYGNVLHAFKTAEALANETKKLPGAEKTFIAHSLGNILTSAAIKDWKLEYSRYYMLNAAVAMEAYDAQAYEPTMIDPVWTNVVKYCQNYHASRWSRLFEQSHGGLDFRRSLSWKGRFAGIANAVNCYSTTEDVTGNIDTNKSLLGWTVWAKQERLKGSALWHFDTVLPCSVVCEGGWGVNTYYMLDDDHNEHGNIRYYNSGTGFTADMRRLSREDAIIHPLFTPFREKEYAGAMHSTDLFTIDDENKRYALRARFLGDAIPAESFAAGANAFSEDSGIGNISMMEECMDNERIWPEVRRDKIKDQPDKLKWHHSDWKQLAYCFVYKLFDKITKNDGGN